MREYRENYIQNNDLSQSRIEISSIMFLLMVCLFHFLTKKKVQVNNQKSFTVIFIYDADRVHSVKRDSPPLFPIWLLTLIVLLDNKFNHLEDKIPGLFVRVFLDRESWDGYYLTLGGTIALALFPYWVRRKLVAQQYSPLCVLTANPSMTSCLMFLSPWSSTIMDCGLELRPK